MEVNTVKIAGLNYSSMTASEQEWLQKACQMEKYRTRSGMFRMRKIRESFNRQFNRGATYDQIRYSVYHACDSLGIERAHKSQPKKGSRMIKNEGESLMAKVERQEQEILSMRQSISELMQIVKG